MVGSMATNLEIVTHLIEDDGLQKIPEFCRINRFVRSRLDLKELSYYQSTGSGSKTLNLLNDGNHNPMLIGSHLSALRLDPMLAALVLVRRSSLTIVIGTGNFYLVWMKTAQ